ncbi:hypothetical protein IGI04_036865 [Brassica rapa subsp. trilocularis]|uniref:Uncharacterized protein n=1 Tax=Brassica rapa subsp. trilocularis TaxID=1813537 RepID=A0ABQ7LFP5_BRACM|nr:hypothetical protein IGI04_036865 [Brassica rapa subsp. trilocularis]
MGDEAMVVVHADHTYELFSQPISQAEAIFPLQRTSRSQRNAEEADNGDWGEKINGLEKGEQAVHDNLHFLKSYQNKLKR